MKHEITIDMDKHCSCGTLGVTESGLCLACAADNIIRLLVLDSGKGATKQDTRSLVAKLSPAESESYGKELAEVIVAKGALECEKAVIGKRIKPLVERLEELAPIVKSGEEVREVECRWYYDFPNRVRHLIRLDTMELVESDGIPAHEHQQSFDLAHGGKS